MSAPSQSLHKLWDQLCPGLSLRMYITVLQVPRRQPEGRTEACYHFMGTLSPPEHRHGRLIQQSYAVTVVTAKGYPPGLSLHDTGLSWRRGSVVATVFQTGIKVPDGHSEPGFEEGRSGGDNVRPEGGSEVSRPYLGTLGCVELQLLPPSAHSVFLAQPRTLVPGPWSKGTGSDPSI